MRRFARCGARWEATARATGTEPAKVVELRRVRPQDAVVVGSLIFAAYTLISRIAEIGFGTVVDELRAADLACAAVALVLAQLTMLGGGISVRGSVPTPLPLLPCVVLQAAIRFINLTVPSAAGRIAMNVRFLQHMGASTPEAVAAGAVDEVSEKLVKALLVLATLPFVSVDIDTSRFADDGPDARLVGAIVIALAVGVAVTIAVPSLRAKVVPRLRVALNTLMAVARMRRKRLELFGGNLLGELVFALVLGAACRAYGFDLSLAELVFVNGGGGRPGGPLPGAGRDRGGRGERRPGVDRGRGRRVGRVRHRPHEAAVHVLSAAALGISGASVAAPQGLRLNPAPRYRRCVWPAPA